MTNAITIRNNLFLDVSQASYGGTGALLLTYGGDGITVDHNTVFTDGTSVVFADGDAALGVSFTNNIVPDNIWAIKGSGTAAGNGTIARYYPGAILRNVFTAAMPRPTRRTTSFRQRRRGRLRGYRRRKLSADDGEPVSDVGDRRHGRWSGPVGHRQPGASYAVAGLRTRRGSVAFGGCRGYGTTVNLRIAVGHPQRRRAEDAHLGVRRQQYGHDHAIDAFVGPLDLDVSDPERRVPGQLSAQPHEAAIVGLQKHPACDEHALLAARRQEHVRKTIIVDAGRLERIVRTREGRTGRLAPRDGVSLFVEHRPEDLGADQIGPAFTGHFITEFRRRVLRDRFEPAPAVSVFGFEPPRRPIRMLRIVLFEESPNAVIGGFRNRRAESRREGHDGQREHDPVNAIATPHTCASCTVRTERHSPDTVALLQSRRVRRSQWCS